MEGLQGVERMYRQVRFGSGPLKLGRIARRRVVVNVRQVAGPPLKRPNNVLRAQLLIATRLS
jgi:hypothetical protein